MSRSKAESLILNILKEITPNLPFNVQVYKEYFAKMSDKDFSAFINRLEKGEEWLTIQIPNYSDTGASTENNIELAKKYFNYNFSQRLWIGSKDDQPEYLTPIEFIVTDIPVKRASQLLTKKISVPDDNKSIDALTGQVTGESKGARISKPELEILSAMGLENTAIELVKYRGGDNKGGIAFDGILSRYGVVQLDSVKPYSSGVESTKTLKTFLTCMHLQNSLPG
jgi:hypothetical protein